jgi:hypothetical protein
MNKDIYLTVSQDYTLINIIEYNMKNLLSNIKCQTLVNNKFEISRIKDGKVGLLFHYESGCFNTLNL